MTINFENMEEGHIKRMVDFANNAYKEMRKDIHYLPEVDYSETLKKRIENLVDNGSGIVAIRGKKIVGFLAGYEVKELFGKCKGIYCPVYGHGALNKDRRRIYQKLYEKAAELWVKNGITNHSITLYSQDEKTIETWFWLGFGLRCIDAIREVSSIQNIEQKYNIKKVKENDIPSLANVQDKLNMYFKKSPMFMSVTKEDSIQHLKNWLNKDNHHIWMAYDNKKKKTIGLMNIESTGERFITENPNMMNITGAYVDKNYRHENIGISLLETIQQWLLENDYKLCGVDYESFNISGNRFWNKYFTPYTYSLVRRIDERILQK